MSDPRPPPYFDVPFPDPPTLYADLPQSVRDAWVAYAKANPIGYLDYKRIVRETGDCYTFVLTMDMAAHQGQTSIVYPPEFSPPEAQQLSSQWADATTGDIVAIPTSRTITEDTTILVWATAPAASPEDIDGADNKFVGAFPLPRDTAARSVIADLGPGYVAAFGSLSAHAGKYCVLWAFACTNGSLRYLGSWTIQIKVVSTLLTTAYWTLAELSGTRHSIGPPAPLSAIGSPTRVAGPIDYATHFNAGVPQFLTLASPEPLEPSGSSWTLSLWINPDDNAPQTAIIGTAASNGDTDPGWTLTLNDPPGDTTLWICDGITRAGPRWATLGLPPEATWTHLAAVYDIDAAEVRTYAHGALDTTSPIAIYPAPGPGPAQIGILNSAFFPLSGALADVTFLRRAMTSAEIAALYNAGAGLRFPYA